MTTNKIKDNGVSLTKPKDITPENIKDSIGINMKELKHTNLKEKYASLEPNNADQYDKDNIISDDELRKRIIDGTLVDDKLEATLFPNGRKE